MGNCKMLYQQVKAGKREAMHKLQQVAAAPAVSALSAFAEGLQAARPGACFPRCMNGEISATPDVLGYLLCRFWKLLRAHML